MKTILLVDDHADTRQVYRMVLEHAGYRVLEAEDGEKGVSAAINERPDLIIMDSRLPGMSGSQAARVIQAGEGLGEIPIVGVTAAPRRMGEGEEEHDPFIHSRLWKPLRPTELLSHIQKILDDS